MAYEGSFECEHVDLVLGVVLMTHGLELKITNMIDEFGDETLDHHEAVCVVAGNREIGFFTITVEPEEDFPLVN